MFSQSKKLDKELLLEIGLMVEQLVRIQQIDLAEKYGESYLKLSEKVNTHDYTKEDEALDRADQRMLQALKWNMPPKNTSQLDTQLQEQEFRLYQQARRPKTEQKSWSSVRAVISERYGLSVETFLKNNTLTDGLE